jgi:peroxiredoxin
MKSSFQRHQLFTTIVILILGLGWIVISAAFFEPSTADRIYAPKEGFIAPDFSLQDPTGENFVLSDLRGHPVLINFWTSWCPPCRTEMPAMQRVFETYRDQNFVILAVNATHQDSPIKASEFVEEFKLTFPILFDNNGTVTSQYQVSSFPSSFFVDTKGFVHEIVIGGPMAEALLITRVRALLGSER